MARHMSRPVLLRLFGGAAPQAEADALLPHLGVCPRCRSRAVDVIAELRRDRALVHLNAERHAFVSLIEEEESRAIELLRARGWWSELRELSPAEQIEKVRSKGALQAVSIFDTMLEDAKGLLSVDPYRAEQQALAAEAVAHSLPATRFSLQFKSDRQGEALIMVANCRRLSADWAGSLNAIAVAKNHLKRGMGDTLLLARLLSVHASLACDTGRPETALGMLNRAREILLEEGEVEELGVCLVQLAGTLLADNSHKEALSQAWDALRLVAKSAPKREMLARAIIVESLIELDRPFEALHAYWAHRSLFDEQAAQGSRLQVLYLEARLLDGLDYARESDKLFRKVIDGYLEADLYKESFRVALTLFDSYFRRSLLDKAAKLCQESIERVQRCGGHEQMVSVWEELLRLAVGQLLERRHLVEARQYLARHWHQPAASPPFTASAVTDLQSEVEAPVALPNAVEPEEPIPSNSSELLAEGFYPAVEHFERQLISDALSQTGGRIREAHRVLQLSRNGLKAKMRKYGLIAGKGDSK